MAFQTIRPRYLADIGRHEASHCGAILHLMGLKNVIRVSTDRTDHYRPANDRDMLTILGSGIKGCQFFNAGWHYGGIDISQAVAIWSKMPRQAAEWREALDRAAEIIRVREAFIDEVGYRLEYEGELSGDAVDAIWLSFYPAPKGAFV
jgi:hypothetical protein